MIVFMQIKIKREFPSSAELGDGVDHKQSMRPEQIYEIFRKISERDCIALGFNPEFARPDWFLITVLPVSPPAVR
jgi:DNA-directed RNA polymerase II subunit RPB1